MRGLVKLGLLFLFSALPLSAFADDDFAPLEEGINLEGPMIGIGSSVATYPPPASAQPQLSDREAALVREAAREVMAEQLKLEEAKARAVAKAKEQKCKLNLIEGTCIDVATDPNAIGASAAASAWQFIEYRKRLMSSRAAEIKLSKLRARFFRNRFSYITTNSRFAVKSSQWVTKKVKSPISAIIAVGTMIAGGGVAATNIEERPFVEKPSKRPEENGAPSGTQLINK